MIAYPETRIIDGTTSEILIGELTWIVTGGASFTDINFVPRANGDGSTTQWFEDGITTGKNPSNGSFTLGPPVRIGIPEPSAVALIGLLGPALLARRRNAPD